MYCQYLSTLTNLTLIKLFSKMLKFPKIIISSKSINTRKENYEYLGTFHLLKWIFQNELIIQQTCVEMAKVLTTLYVEVGLKHKLSSYTTTNESRSAHTCSCFGGLIVFDKWHKTVGASIWYQRTISPTTMESIHLQWCSICDPACTKKSWMRFISKIQWKTAAAEALKRTTPFRAPGAV
jgi:hypothetical protein